MADLPAMAVMVLTVLTLSACENPASPDPSGGPPLDSQTVRLIVQPGGAILEGIGADVRFTAEAVDKAGEPVDLESAAVEWSVSNPEVARISPEGRLTALRDAR